MFQFLNLSTLRAKGVNILVMKLLHLDFNSFLQWLPNVPCTEAKLTFLASIVKQVGTQTPSHNKLTLTNYHRQNNNNITVG